MVLAQGRRYTGQKNSDKCSPDGKDTDKIFLSG
jgi:hypothetical protein